MFDKMKQAAKDAADAAGRAALAATDKAGEAAAAGVEKAAVIARDPATHAKAKIVARGAAKGAAQGAGKAAQGAGKAAGGAGRLAKTALDKLNPSTLAAIVMKATSIQEQANAVLRRNKSLYRIGGIEIGAAFPPSISFQIVRAAELELEEQALEGLLIPPPGASAGLESSEVATSDGAG